MPSARESAKGGRKTEGQWMLREEVGGAQDGIPGPAHGVWSWVDTVGQIRFWNRFCPWLAVCSWASVLHSLGLCFLIYKMGMLNRWFI